MNQVNIENEFKKLKKFTFTNATVSFWIVRRRLRKKVATYTVKNVQIDKSLEPTLLSVIRNKIKKSNNFAEYEYFTADSDDSLLTIQSNETDFEDLVKQIDKGSDSNMVKSNEELFGTWAYIIKVMNKNNFILGFKKIEDVWDIKKRNSINVLFKNQKFLDLKEDDVFKLERYVDFLYFNNFLFVVNKKKFELGLNFREGMIVNRDALLEEFKTMSIVDNIDKIRDKVGENMKYLRQLSSIKKNGYFRHPGFMKKLEIVNKSEKWGLSIKNGRIQIEDDNIETVLKVLNKDRLKDLIEGETFDVAVKKSVSAN